MTTDDNVKRYLDDPTLPASSHLDINGLARTVAKSKWHGPLYTDKRNYPLPYAPLADDTDVGRHA